LTTKRVFLLGTPTMLTELVKGILAGEPDIEVSQHLESGMSLKDITPASNIDVLVVAAEEVSNYDIAEFLLHRCKSRVLGVSSDGRQATLHELRPHRVSLGELSPRLLVSVVRGEPSDSETRT
jgi:hypothetical protein